MDATAAAAAVPSSSSSSSCPAAPVTKQRVYRRPAPTLPPFLSNLGKATLRGIRRCPRCGVYNGTRGLSCKNKACGVSLRSSTAAAAAGRSAVEVVRLITSAEEKQVKEEEGEEEAAEAESGSQVFSVCHRGRGAAGTQWGLVELVPTDTAIATGDGATLLTRINLGRCFLPSCRQGQRSGQRQHPPGAAKPASDGGSLCVHIKQAIESSARATPLTLKSSSLDGLRASVELREELWGLATETPGPLVQRVSKDTLVVKCHTDSQHPLGLLHFTVGAGGSKSDKSIFHCACQGSGRRDKAKGGGAGERSVPGSAPAQPCLHFYACVCAFASNDKLAAEFAAFMDYSSCGVLQNPSSRLNPGESPPVSSDTGSTHPKTKKLRLSDPASVPSRPPTWKDGVSGPRRATSRKAAGALKATGSAQAVDERTVAISFHQWLASVTEQIHQTMHYQFDGRPEPLVFYIPQEFFNALQQRLSLGSKKRRLPNFTTAFVRKDGAPVGSFSKYTWHINSLLQVKRIFDTPELPLEVTQSFLKNADGSYSRFHCAEPSPETDSLDRIKTERAPAIRPMELRTFLKAGPADQKNAAPFVIEWIPGVLPRSQMGELRLRFEFGHQQSGQQDPSERKGAAERGGAGKPAFCQTDVTEAVETPQVNS